MTMQERADFLIEIRRYVRTNPVYVKEQLSNVTLWFETVPTDLMRNILVGIEYIQVDPEILENYLYNAAFELMAGAPKKPAEAG